MDPACGEKDTLVILWTTRDPEVARNMAFMYAKNAQEQAWFDHVRIIVWGPSAEVLAHDTDLQSEAIQLREAGVALEACRACAERYGVSDALEHLGVLVRYMGEPLTEYLKHGYNMISV